MRRLHVILFYSITTFVDDKEARSEIMNFMDSRNLVFQLKPQQCDLSCVQCTVVFKTHANSMLHLLRITGWEKSDTNHVLTVIRGWCNITANGEAACTTIILSWNTYKRYKNRTTFRWLHVIIIKFKVHDRIDCIYSGSGVKICQELKRVLNYSIVM